MNTRTTLADHLFGGHVRAKILTTLARNQTATRPDFEENPESLRHALKRLTSAGIIKEDSGTFSMCSDFVAKNELRNLVRVMDGAEPEEGEASGSRPLIRPLLFGRESCTKVLLSLSTCGALAIPDLAQRSGVPRKKVHRIVQRLAALGILENDGGVSLNQEIPAAYHLAALIAACAT